MVGGMLIVGSQPEQKLTAVVPVFECPPGTNPDEPGPVDQARPFEPKAMAFDRRAGKLVAVTGAEYGVETWTFDVCTNTWTQMEPDQTPPEFAEYPGLVYDVDSDVTIGIASGSVWAYDLQADTWTEKGDARAGGSWTYDPVSGLVVAASSDDEFWNYDVETDAWTPIHQTIEPGDEPGLGVFTYDASVDRIVSYANPETWLFDLRTGTWSRSGAETPDLVGGYGWSPPTIAYDEAAERTVVLGFVPRVTPFYAPVSAYDATADRWEIDAMGTDVNLGTPAMVYDPVNERLIGAGSEVSPGPVGLAGVFALDLVTREWTTLLETGEGPPSPGSE
jgi:hypothetical protein